MNSHVSTKLWTHKSPVSSKSTKFGTLENKCIHSMCLHLHCTVKAQFWKKNNTMFWQEFGKWVSTISFILMHLESWPYSTCICIIFRSKNKCEKSLISLHRNVVKFLWQNCSTRWKNVALEIQIQKSDLHLLQMPFYIPKIENEP